MRPWRQALVVGLGKSGQAAARLLLQCGTAVRGYDARPDVSPLPEGVDARLGETQPHASLFADIDLLVLSPGVPPGPWRRSCARHAPHAAIHGELSLALSLIPPKRRPRLVLITGTNGKSTVTALVGALLRAGGAAPFVGGNLGDPLADAVAASRREAAPWPTDMVLECSSFQLETLRRVPTAAAAVLNVAPDHLDRYPDLETYARTKARVFAGLEPRGLALLADGDTWSEKIAPGGCDVRWIGDPQTAWIEGEGSGQMLRLAGDPPIARSDLRVAGRHNAVNALFALAIARHLGVTPRACAEGLRAFDGLPHRMVLVREAGGVRYYNDSKATNVASALATLGGLDAAWVLIAGGQHKGDDLTPLGELLTARGRGLVAIGEAAEKFRALAADRVPAQTASDMAAAVMAARALAQPGDAVVLAPACASFDQFANYAARGEAFEAAVRAL